MPSNWLSVDSNFPSFTGEESATQQIRMLHNYLFCLKEHLQYSLQNLTADNWNASALQSLTDGAKDQLGTQLSGISSQLAQLKLQVDALQGRVTDTSDFDKRITAVEEASVYWEQRLGNAESDVIALQVDVAGHEQRISDLEKAIEELSAVIQTAEDGSVTIGTEGQVLHLVGEVYLNGTLLNQGGTDETA